MTIILRPHHILCLHAFSGKGYNQLFIENMASIKAMLLSNPDMPIKLSVGLDSICNACPHLRDFGCAKGDVFEEFNVKRLDRNVSKLAGLHDAQIIPARIAFEKVEKSIGAEQLRIICANCEWLKIGSCLEKISIPFFSFG